jgi:hypothetical protein
MKCAYCSISLKNSNSLYTHKNRVTYCPGSAAYTMSAVEKRIRVEKSCALVQFNPKLGISASLMTILADIEDFIQRNTALAQATPHLINAEQLISAGIGPVCFMQHKAEDLNKLKGVLSQKQFEFKGKQETVKESLDAMVAQCGMVIGRDSYESLLGSPPHYEISMEKLLVNHIRQRTMAELNEQSDTMLEVFLIAVMQTKIFRQAEAEMGNYLYIENLIDKYLRNLSHSDFLYERGRMSSQADGGGDDGSTVNENY